jgi:DNA-binding CsgD family transcriptional regulator
MSVDPIKLSVRETEVCNLLLAGNSTNKIAEVLNIKCNTVSTFKRLIFIKTNTKNLIELYEVCKHV